MPQFLAGRKYRASDASWGFVAEATDTTSNNSTTTTEVVSSSITFTAVAGVRYKVTYMGAMESTVAGDQCYLRLRWKNTSTVDTSGTQFAITSKVAATAARGDTFVLIGPVTGQGAGSLVVAATIVRSLGTGTVKQNLASSGQPGYFLVEEI